MSDCARVGALALRWQEGGEISAAELRDVETHCAGCGQCAERFSAILPFLARDARGEAVDPSEGPSPGFTDAVMGRVKSRLPSPHRTTLTWMLAAAASVVLLAGIGLFAYRLGAGRAGAEVLVHFQLAAPGAQSVALVGSFTGWEATKLPMSDPNHDGIWEISVRLKKASVHTYNFLIDGTRWVPDPAAQGQVDDGFGGQSSIVAL